MYSLKITGLLLMVVVIVIAMSGCLATEIKEYHFQINYDGSGSGTIKYINIVSEEDDEKDVSFDDFGELITNYLEGTAIEEENPGYTILGKELNVVDSQLIGEIKFEFNLLEKVSFWRDQLCECSPILFYFGSLSETLQETDGTYLHTDENEFPLIMWPANTTEFSFKTHVKEDMSDAHSLAPLYQTWKMNR